MYHEAKFHELGETRVATDDGTYGIHGNVGNLLMSTHKQPKAVFACGAKWSLKNSRTTFCG